MKKYGWIILLLFGVLMHFGSLEAAPQGITYPGIYHTMYLVQTPMAKKPQNYVDLIFAPLGWSKDGKFAYITGRDPGGAGYEVAGYFRWVIQDMGTDRILWESPKGLEPGLPKQLLYNTDQLKVFKWVYVNLNGRYRKYLERYKINIIPNLKLLKFPVYYNNNKFNASLTGITKVTRYDIPGIVGSYRVNVSRNGKVKTVSHYFNPRQLLLDVQIAGYLKSPYEPRIAIAIGQIERGWEGPPNPVQLELTGCRLDKGF